MRYRRDRVVLFVDDDLWHCFNQLAASLSKSAIAPVRVVTGRQDLGRYGRFVERMLYRDTISLCTPMGVDRLRSLVASGAVLDVQVNEETLDRAGPDVAALIEQATGVERAQRVSWVDKAELATILAGAGVPTPGQQAASVCVLAGDGGIETPSVVNRAIGSGGTSVRIVHDGAALTQAVDELGDGNPDRVIVQRFVHGDLMGYGGLWGDDGPIAEFTAIEHKARSNPLGPTAIVTTCDDPALLELGRTVVKTLGCRGLVAIECIVDRDNTYHVIDVSPRAWGSFMAYAQAGVDFAAEYRAGARGRAATPALAPHVSRPNHSRRSRGDDR